VDEKMESSQIQLREFLPTDYNLVLALWQATEGVGLSEGDSLDGVSRLLMRNPGLSWLAFSDGSLVGAVLCGHDGRRGLIYHLTVVPEVRRLGIATTLVKAALNGLRAVGIEQCYSLVYQTNAVAREFWSTIGGTERGDLVLFRTGTSQTCRG
jgi:putative acetyltransferase